MARKLSIDNDTHWKTSDIRRIVRAAIDEAGADLKQKRVVIVKRQPKGSRISYQYKQQTGVPHITIYLPRKGPKTLHHNALVALAAAGIDASTPMLAVSDSYFLANALAWEFSCEVEASPARWSKHVELTEMKRSTNPPPWGDGTTLIITKYADPLKDGTYRDFVAKREAQIERAQERASKYLTARKKAERGLKKARKDIKEAQDAIADAKARRITKKVTV